MAACDDAGVTPTRSLHRPITLRRLAGPALAAAATWLLPGPVTAHGEAPDAPPTLASLVFGWTFEPAVVLPLVAAAWLWLVAVRRVAAHHPDNPVPTRRTVAFLAGLTAIAVALLSGIGAYDTTLFSLHMVQHILLALVAAPLIALAAPVTLLLRVASADDRRRRILPVLHSRVVRAIGHPVVAWVVFAAVMWGSHFSALFDAALEDQLLHDLEHGLFLGAGLLFWWPAVGADPGPWRLPEPARALYVFLQMPQNTFLSVAILFAGTPLYAHYTSLEAGWLPDPLADQQLAGAIMWFVGDVTFLVAVLALLAAWLRRDDREAAAGDRRADVARVRLREREVALAERLAGRPSGEAD
jgi:putative copper resistance protein D